MTKENVVSGQWSVVLGDAVESNWRTFRWGSVAPAYEECAHIERPSARGVFEVSEVFRLAHWVRFSKIGAWFPAINFVRGRLAARAAIIFRLCLFPVRAATRALLSSGDT